MTFLRNLFSRRSHSDRAGGAALLSPPENAAPAAAVEPPKLPEPPPARVQVPPGECVSIRLKAITDFLQEELKPALRKQPSEHVEVQIPHEWIRPQLAAGAVRITFEELRAVTPDVFFHANVAAPDAKVALPLQSVLAQMPLTRREDQKVPAVPVSIPSVFTKAGNAGGNGIGGGRASKDAWYSHRKLNYDQAVEPEEKPEPVSKPEPAGNLAIETHPKNEEMPADFLKSLTIGIRTKPDVGMAREATAAAPPPAIAVAQPVDAPAPVLAPAPEPESPAPTAASTPPEIPAPAAPSMAPAISAAPDCFALPAATILASLPYEVVEVLNRHEPDKAAFQIPLDEIEAMMRTGKLLFKWGRMRQWCSVRLDESLAPAATDVELPLQTVVPIFMASRKSKALQRHFEIDSRIPDIFSKLNSPAEPPSTPEPAPAVATPAAPPDPPAPPSTPAIAAGAPLRLAPEPPVGSAPEPAPAADAPAQIPQSVPGEPEPIAPAPAHEPAGEASPVFAAPAVVPMPATEPATLQAPPTQPAPTALTPAQIIEELRRIEVVTGAFIATSDGLLIAGDVPGSNEKVLAAFAPTVFTHLTKYSGMAKLGAPESLDIHFAASTIHLRKIGKVFLGVIAPRGAALPPEPIQQLSKALQPRVPDKVWP